MDCPKVEHSGDATIAPNVYNSFGTISGTLTVTKGNEKPNVLNIYILKVTAAENLSIVFSGWELNWLGGEAPVFESGKTYEISIIDNLALCLRD